MTREDAYNDFNRSDAGPLLRALRRVRQRHARKLNRTARRYGYLDRGAWRLTGVTPRLKWELARRIVR